MQQKRNSSALGIIKIVVVLAVIVGVVVLMTVNVPAPMHPIEKEVDAKPFLENNKQP